MKEAVLEEVTTEKTEKKSVDEPEVIENQMPGIQKAAILFQQLGSDEIKLICRYLDRSDVEKLSSCLKQYEYVNRNDLLATVREFQSQTIGLISSGTPQEKAQLFIEQFEEVQIESTPEGKKRSQLSNLYSLEKMSPERVIDFFKNDHDQVLAVVLSQLSSDFSKEILSLLEPEKRSKILQRISTIKNVDLEFLKNLDETLKAKISSSSDPSGFNGPQIAANILSLFPEEESKNFMTDMEKDCKPVLEKIKQYYLTFSDLILLDNDTLQKILATVDPQVLAQAICKSSQETIDKCFSVITKRAVTLIEEELKSLENALPAVVQHARQIIIKNARQLESERKIDLGKNKK